MTYFSEARGLRKGFGIVELRVMVRDLYQDLEDRGYLTEWIGHHCVDYGFVAGTAGRNPSRDVVRDVGRTDIWPPEPDKGEWSEDAIFDFLQFIGGKVSLAIPETGKYHSFNDCGWHGQDFEVKRARSEFLTSVNKILSRYSDGWEMNRNFEIVERAPAGMENLLNGKLPGCADRDVHERVQAAVDKYRRRSASVHERRDAVRDLGDVLEPLRAEGKKHLGADENDLFNILNNFNIRHNDKKQKKDYDPIWLAGLFYHYLAMIHVLTRIIEREATNPEK